MTFCLGVYCALSVNFAFHAFLSEVMMFGQNLVISLFDSMGFEVHFIRMFYLTVFDHSITAFEEVKTTQGIILDATMILVVITPCFLLGLKYIVAPTHENYPYFNVSLITPLPLVTVFFFECLDVVYLSGFTVLLNLYVSWRLMD